MFMKRDIVNSRYVVRNILVVTLALAILALGVGIVVLVADQVNGSENEVYVAEAAEKKETPVITYSPAGKLDTASVDALRAAMEEMAVADITVNEAQMVTGGVEGEVKIAVATTNNVNIREAADPSATAVGKMDVGAVCEIIDEKEDWLKITSGEVEGYVSTDYVAVGDEAKELAEKYYKIIGTVNEDGVCVRTEPSTDAAQVKSTNKDDTYKVVKAKSDDEWICILTSVGGEAYISADYIDIEEGYVYAYPLNTVKLVQPGEKDKETEETVTTEAEQPTTTEAPLTEATEQVTEEQPVVEEEPVVEEQPEEVVTEEEYTNPMSISEEDFYLMAAVVYCESGAESYEGQLAVANVILNRLRSASYGNTISDVVYAPSQFTVVGTQKFYNCLGGNVSSTTLQACMDACAGTNNVGNCIGFRPTWAIDTSTLSYYIQIGNHIFF